jgi:hypothetical protein
MDLRQMGEPFEKKFTQFSDDDIQKVIAALTTNGKPKKLKTFLSSVIPQI